MTATQTTATVALANLTERERVQLDNLLRGRVYTIEQEAQDSPESAMMYVTRAKEALTPDTVATGNGVTMHLHSDSHACTIVGVKRNGKQIIIQRDKATRTNKDKDVFYPGGFVGHVDCTEGQEWAYERDENGSIHVANWSEKKQRFFVGGPSGRAVTAGRHEHYDYNF